MSKVTLTSFPMDSAWVKGEVNDRGFVAKLYDEPSDYGINRGRVSKLWIDGVANYDRGWDFGEDEPAVYDVVDFLEVTPKRFEDWDSWSVERKSQFGKGGY